MEFTKFHSFIFVCLFVHPRSTSTLKFLFVFPNADNFVKKNFSLSRVRLNNTRISTLKKRKFLSFLENWMKNVLFLIQLVTRLKALKNIFLFSVCFNEIYENFGWKKENRMNFATPSQEVKTDDGVYSTWKTWKILFERILILSLLFWESRWIRFFSLFSPRAQIYEMYLETLRENSKGQTNVWDWMII